MKDSQNSDINELVITGLIVSRVKHHDRKDMFTLRSSHGRFRVEWCNPSQSLKRNQRVMVYGEIYSVFYDDRHQTHVRANRVVVLHDRGSNGYE